MSVRAVRLERVVRRYGRHVALRQVSLTLRAGEVTLLVGPNGAGKTTLLAVLATLSAPTRGKVTVQWGGGSSLREMSLADFAAEHRDEIGLVSHASLIYDDLTGRENLELFARLYGMKVEIARQRARTLLAEVDLGSSADRRVGEYSRGMRQRLSIARAMLQDPSVVLLDEPYTGLDRSGRHLLHGIIGKLREGRLVMLITHNLDLPESLIDRAILLSQGRVIADAHPDGSVAMWYEEHLAMAS